MSGWAEGYGFDDVVWTGQRVVSVTPQSRWSGPRPEPGQVHPVCGVRADGGQEIDGLFLVLAVTHAREWLELAMVKVPHPEGETVVGWWPVEDAYGFAWHWVPPEEHRPGASPGLVAAAARAKVASTAARAESELRWVLLQGRPCELAMHQAVARRVVRASWG